MLVAGVQFDLAWEDPAENFRAFFTPNGFDPAPQPDGPRKLTPLFNGLALLIAVLTARLASRRLGAAK